MIAATTSALTHADIEDFKIILLLLVIATFLRG
jgi:hypothetical protein